MSATPGSATVAIPSEVDIAIVGGGIMGLATAYQLAQLGKRSGKRLRVAVIERSYLVSGASGRNGGGLRMQWGDPGNVALMMESIGMCRTLAQELGINLWFRQGGYLFLARSPHGENRLLRNVDLHREVGAKTRLLTAAEAKDLVPHLDTSDVIAATYNPDDGVVFPWPFVWGYAAQAQALGVVVRTYTSVDRLTPARDGFDLELSDGHTIWAPRVVNATGAWSNQLNRQLGFETPNRPHRHEILSSEPLKPFLDPLVVDLSTGLYFSQSTRGELVTGVSLPPAAGYEDDSLSMHSSLRFLGHVSRCLCKVLPIARAMKILRQWAGPYDLTPDGDAIVGPSPGHPGLIQLCGFTGHGFMMAPAVGRILAHWLVDQTAHPMLQRWHPSRFERGLSQRYEDMSIG